MSLAMFQTEHAEWHCTRSQIRYVTFFFFLCKIRFMAYYLDWESDISSFTIGNKILKRRNRDHFVPIV